MYFKRNSFCIYLIIISLLFFKTQTIQKRNLLVLPNSIIQNPSISKRSLGSCGKGQCNNPSDIISNCQQIKTVFSRRSRSYICQVCFPGYKLHDQGKSCIPGVYYCNSYSKIDDSRCNKCIQPYVLVPQDNFCYRTVNQCYLFNYITNTCKQCIDGYTIKDNLCRLRPCQSGQYLETNGKCVKGNVQNCVQYSSPSGTCQICKPTYKLVGLICEAPPTCPASDKDWFWVVRYGKCLKISIGCTYINDDGCGACQFPYYLQDKECKLQGVDEIQLTVNGQI